MTDNKTIKKAISWLVSQGIVKNQKEVGEDMGIINRSYLSQLVNSASPSAEFVNKFNDKYPYFNPQWLLTGEGEMLKKKENSASLLGKAKPAINEELAQVRFFDLKPSASFREFCSSGSEEPEAMSILPERNETLCDEHCIFIVHGDSMEPQIHSKAKVLCEEIKPTKWHMVDGGVVIAYADRFVIKRVIKNRLATENYILLGSDNPDFPEQERAPLCDIRCIFRACRILSQQIS